MLTTFTAVSQDSGAVSGVVLNSFDGAPLSGATVTVRGTTLAGQTDSTGRFELKNLPPGDQVLRISKSGFAAAVVTDVRVIPGQTTTVNGNLRPEFYEMEEYEVTAEEFTQQTEQILMERKDSSSLMEAIGSEQFSKQNLGDAAEALGKVSGASIADGKFAVIRGLADRYTSTTINGTDLPSADPDRRAAQLDLIPSQFIGRMDVYKTFSPDLPGGFVGGAIDIVTRKFPEKFLLSVSLGTSYNTQSSLRDDYLKSDTSSTDWMAKDDGKRARTSPFSTQIAPVRGESPLNQSYAITLGNSHEVFGRRFGYMAGINYKSEFQHYGNGNVSKYEGAFSQVSGKKDVKSVTEYTWSGMASVGLELLEGHEIGFNYMQVQTAEDEARTLVGFDNGALSPAGDDQPLPTLNQSVLHWTERTLDYSQFNGKHVFSALNDVQVTWAAMFANATQDEPDHRLFQYADFGPGSQTRYLANVQSKPSKPLRMWRTIEEESSGIRADVSIPLPSYNTKENFFKSGFWRSQSERKFDSTILQIDTSTAHPFTASGDPAAFLAPSNSAFFGYSTFGSGNWIYNAEQDINAYYFMGDWAATEWMRLVGGVRFENTYLKVDARDLVTGIRRTPKPIDQHDLLPGVGVTFSLRENLQFRLAYSQTVARPAYRELGRAEIYDIAENKTYKGNPDLQMASAQNYDARLEWYPRPGEIVSLSAYMKTIQDPIEQIQEDPSVITYRNSEKADVVGVEAEWTTSLDLISSHLKDFSFGINASYIKSKVQLTQAERNNRALFQDTATSRPLYDQPEYTFNGELTWDCKYSGTLVNVSMGIVGRRLVLGGLYTPDEYEEPAPQLNVTLSQKLGKNWKLKFAAKNLLDPEYETTQTWPRYYEAGVVDIPGRKVVLKSYTKGITFGVSLGCEF